MTDEELFNAIDGLKTYDGGARDSGIHDEALRARVLGYLRGLGGEELRAALARLARGYLTDEAIAQGYGLADVLSLADWLEANGIFVRMLI